MIPEELKSWPNWVIWREVERDGKPTKIPYCARGGMADTTNPSTWSTFDVAVEAAQRLLCGIGFVFSRNDPYAGIDLDDPTRNTTIEESAIIAARHMKIVESFDTYSELSPSGSGLHLIVKGAVKEGKRRNKVEVYSSDRFFTITGNTYQNKPIAERDYLLNTLWSELNEASEKEVIEIKEQAETRTDSQICEQASQAVNGDKFLTLWQGKWMEAGYPSASEADFALINILSFYSRNVEQIRRMFRQSMLAHRSDKAKRDKYVDTMIKRSFDNQPPYVELAEVIANTKKQIEVAPSSNPFAGPLFEKVADPSYEWTCPPGLLGEIATFVYSAAPRQVKEIALAAAIGLMAGICGRQYNISATGLNQYVLLLAGTGRGKEAMALGIDRLMGHVKMKVPAALDFIGPTEIASGQALIKFLGRQPCFVSVVGEYGLTLQAMCHFNANSSQILLRKKMLELYMKSGAGNLMQPSIYSDKEKNTQIIHSPAFTLLGESTPESYYGGLDEIMIQQGLLPRFLCIEYTGKRPPLNENHANAVPGNALVEQLSELCANCLTMAQNNRVMEVKQDKQALAFSNAFEKKTTAKINESNVIIAQELWNRAHLKALKLASLIAIGINHFEPIITLDCMKWAHDLVERDINNVFKRFEEGKVGRSNNEGNQVQEMIRVIKDYLYSPYDERMQKYLVEPLMHADRVVALSYLQRRLMQSGAFRQDKMGSTYSIKRTIETLVNEGALGELRHQDTKIRYGKSMKAFAVIQMERFI